MINQRTYIKLEVRSTHSVYVTRNVLFIKEKVRSVQNIIKYKCIVTDVKNMKLLVHKYPKANWLNGCVC
jgi:hypothetical protein